MVRRSWRDVLDPSTIDSRWSAYGFGASVLIMAVIFLMAVGRLDGFWPLIVSVPVGMILGGLIYRQGRDAIRGRAIAIREREDFAVLWITLTEHGYVEMARQFDQVAESWMRGRVLDQSWEDVRLAVVEAVAEYAEHRTAADKANPEWMRAMKTLDDVRTHLGLQGLG